MINTKKFKANELVGLSIVLLEILISRIGLLMDYEDLSLVYLIVAIGGVLIMQKKGLSKKIIILIIYFEIVSITLLYIYNKIFDVKK